MMLDVNIKKDFSSFSLDVAFSFEKGVLGILGASGCGKTLTLKSIAGISELDDGFIRYNNQCLYDKKNKICLKPQTRNIGYLFQNYALFPNMTVRENIIVGIKDKNDNHIINEMISIFRLKGLENKYPHQLSGGQQQRVALARIFASTPNLLLFDEPFSALDSYLKDQIKVDFSNMLKQFSIPSIIVSHDRDEIYQLCDNVLIMDKGQVIEQGITEEIFIHPKHTITAQLTGCKNISRIKKIDDYHVECLDFNYLILETGQKVTDEIQAIGIRAHQFQQCHEYKENCITLKNATISKMPFVWHVTLSNGIVYKLEKTMKQSQNDLKLSKYLYIDKNDILLLK